MSPNTTPSAPSTKAASRFHDRWPSPACACATGAVASSIPASGSFAASGGCGAMGAGLLTGGVRVHPAAQRALLVCSAAGKPRGPGKIGLCLRKAKGGGGRTQLPPSPCSGLTILAGVVQQLVVAASIAAVIGCGLETG